MSHVFRMTYVTFEERPVQGQARPKTSPVYHPGRSVYATPKELLKANLDWLAAKIAANLAAGRTCTRIEFNALDAKYFATEEQPK